MSKMKDVIVYNENPFLQEIEIKLKNKKVFVSHDIDKRLVDSKSGQEKPVFIGSYKEVDEEEFVKIFTSNIAYMFELTPAGNKVFHFLLTEVQKKGIGKDVAYLSYESAKQNLERSKLKISKTVFWSGLKDLIHNKILARSSSINLYYINPNILFNGDRVAFFNAIKKKNSGKKQIEAQSE